MANPCRVNTNIRFNEKWDKYDIDETDQIEIWDGDPIAFDMNENDSGTCRDTSDWTPDGAFNFLIVDMTNSAGGAVWAGYVTTEWLLPEGRRITGFALAPDFYEISYVTGMESETDACLHAKAWDPANLGRIVFKIRQDLSGGEMLTNALWSVGSDGIEHTIQMIEYYHGGQTPVQITWKDIASADSLDWGYDWNAANSYTWPDRGFAYVDVVTDSGVHELSDGQYKEVIPPSVTFTPWIAVLDSGTMYSSTLGDDGNSIIYGYELDGLKRMASFKL